MFDLHQMSYRRDAPSTEQIPLPIETVYCSEIDAVMRARNTLSGTKFNRFGIDNFNRVDLFVLIVNTLKKCIVQLML